MNLCFLANAKSIHTQRWVEYWAKRNKVTVISFEPYDIDYAEVITLPKLFPERRLNILMNIPNVRRLVKKINPDILHAHYATSYGFVGACSGFHPYIVTAWGSDILVEPNNYFYRKLVNFSLSQADLITTVAPNITNKIVREHIPMHPVLDEKTVVTLPFGVDTEMFNPYKRIRYKDEIVVISTRRPDNGLDVDTFIRAIPGVLERCNAWFVLTGTGKLLDSMKELASKLGVSHRIDFQGHVPHYEMPNLLRSSDIFVSTSPTDGNNISLNEAMACGVFPVVTDIDANRQWVTHQKNGLLYPCKNVKGLAKNIIEGILNPQWRKDVLMSNWEIVRTKASWKTSMEEMAFMYHWIHGIYEERKCLSV